jgi:hypothetical protein
MYWFHAGYYWSVARRKPDRSKFPLRDVSQIVKYNEIASAKFSQNQSKLEWPFIRMGALGSG